MNLCLNAIRVTSVLLREKMYGLWAEGETLRMNAFALVWLRAYVTMYPSQMTDIATWQQRAMKNQDPLTGKGIRGEVRKPSFAIWHLKLSNHIQHKYFTINLLHQKGCKYDRLHNVAQNPGILLAELWHKDYPGCQINCQDHIKCNSYTYCPKNRLCYLYDRILHSNEPQHKKDDCFSSYGGDCKHGKYCWILKHKKCSFVK